MEGRTARLVADMYMGRIAMSALAFLVWDIIISLSEEIRLVWSKSNTNWTKWLFLFVRYSTLALEIVTMFSASEIFVGFTWTPRQCVGWFIGQEVGLQLIVSGVEIMLMVRVMALYHGNHTLRTVLIVLFAAEVAVMISILVFLSHTVGLNEHCLVDATPILFIVYAAAFGSFESVLVGLTLYKAVTAYKEGWGRRAPLLRIVVRDGTWAFLLIFAILCINLGLYLGIKGVGKSGGLNWFLTIEEFAGCHLMLQMDALGRRNSQANSRRNHLRKRRGPNGMPTITITEPRMETGVDSTGAVLTSVFELGTYATEASDVIGSGSGSGSGSAGTSSGTGSGGTRTSRSTGVGMDAVFSPPLEEYGEQENELHHEDEEYDSQDDGKFSDGEDYREDDEGQDQRALEDDEEGVEMQVFIERGGSVRVRRMAGAGADEPRTPV